MEALKVYALQSDARRSRPWNKLLTHSPGNKKCPRGLGSILIGLLLEFPRLSVFVNDIWINSVHLSAHLQPLLLAH